MAYAFDRDEAYARKAVALIEAWCLDPATAMTPAFQEYPSRIELSITMPGLFYGADLIWDSPAWDDASRDAFRGWVRQFLASAMTWSGRNNFENWRLVVMASAAAFLGDTDTLSRAFERYRELIPAQMNAAGQMLEEIGRTTSLSYSTFAINAMIQTAEIARHHGVNLYDYETTDGRGLRLAIEHHAPFVADPSRWTLPQITEYGGDNAALFELAYSQWQQESSLQAIERWGRPMIETRTMGPVTLTHAHRFELDVQNPDVDAVEESSEFSAIPYFGDRNSYAEQTASHWSVRQDDGDARYSLNTSDYAPLSGDRLGEHAIVRGRSYRDFVLTLRAKSPEDLEGNPAADYCVVFGYQDASNYYYMMFNATAEHNQMFRVVDGSRVAIEDVGAALIADNAYHEIEAIRRGASITIRVDGIDRLSVEDATFRAGGVGVGSFNDAAFFDDIALISECDGCDGGSTDAVPDDPSGTIRSAAGGLTAGCGCAVGAAGVPTPPHAMLAWLVVSMVWMSGSGRRRRP